MAIQGGAQKWNPLCFAPPCVSPYPKQTSPGWNFEIPPGMRVFLPFHSFVYSGVLLYNYTDQMSLCAKWSDVIGQIRLSM